MEKGHTILEFYASTNTSFLHPKGPAATRLLLKNLDAQPGESIMELGFGTAATLVLAASTFKKSNFYGIELNRTMFNKGAKRVKLCVLKNINLKHIESPTQIPFEDNHFDKIYVESVLAIQEGEALGIILKELYRILKPEGRLLLNEGIWADNFTSDSITDMNAFCKSRFGIIQANEKYPYCKDWKALLERTGLTVNAIQNLENIEKAPVSSPLIRSMISRAFSLYGNVSMQLNPNYKKKHSAYKKDIEFTAKQGRYLEGFLIDCTKS